MTTRPLKIIGVDCATNADKVGIVMGVLRADKPRIIYPQEQQQVKVADRAEEIVKLMSGNDPVLLAFDAPLGWPVALSASLADHRAGQHLPTPSDQLFHRVTDAQVYQGFGSGPWKWAQT